MVSFMIGIYNVNKESRTYEGQENTHGSRLVFEHLRQSASAVQAHMSRHTHGNRPYTLIYAPAMEEDAWEDIKKIFL